MVIRGACGPQWLGPVYLMNLSSHSGKAPIVHFSNVGVCVCFLNCNVYGENMWRLSYDERDLTKKAPGRLTVIVQIFVRIDVPTCSAA